MQYFQLKLKKAVHIFFLTSWFVVAYSNLQEKIPAWQLCFFPGYKKLQYEGCLFITIQHLQMSRAPEAQEMYSPKAGNFFKVMEIQGHKYKQLNKGVHAQKSGRKKKKSKHIFKQFSLSDNFCKSDNYHLVIQQSPQMNRLYSLEQFHCCPGMQSDPEILRADRTNIIKLHCTQRH